MEMDNKDKKIVLDDYLVMYMDETISTLDKLSDSDYIYRFFYKTYDIRLDDLARDLRCVLECVHESED